MKADKTNKILFTQRQNDGRRGMGLTAPTAKKIGLIT